jgi:RNA polymerase sigma-32 factor
MTSRNDEVTTYYINKVRAIPVLSREDELVLAKKAVRGNKAATDKLVEANLRYVVSVALKYRRYGIPVSELISEGSIGLMTAVKKFEPNRGNRFVTYAGYWIRAFVLDYVVRSTSMVGGGSGPFRSKIFFRLRRERAKLSQLNLDPTEIIEILAKQFSVTQPRMEELLMRLDGRDVSLNQPAFADAQVTLQDTMSSREPSPEEHYLAAERKAELETQAAAALETLDKRERLIVEKRILGDSEASLAALGRKLGVSRERARQLEVRAKDKLRRQFAAKHRR